MEDAEPGPDDDERRREADGDRRPAPPAHALPQERDGEGDDQ